MSPFTRTYLFPTGTNTITVEVDEDGRASAPEEMIHFMAMHGGFREVID